MKFIRKLNTLFLILIIIIVLIDIMFYDLTKENIVITSLLAISLICSILIEVFLKIKK